MALNSVAGGPGPAPAGRGAGGVEFQLGGGLVVGTRGELRPGWVGVGAGRIGYVGRWPLHGVPRVELEGYVLAPGFIDLHVHGGGGFWLDQPGGLAGFARWAPSQGVTAFLAAPLAESPQAMVERLRALSAWLDAAGEPSGARFLGFYLEGPFLSPARRGALAPGWLAPCELGLLQRLLEAAGGRLRVMTVAPELPGACDIIRALAQAGVVAALGHTDATLEQFREGVRAGARHVTHCFNAMPSMHHRRPGAVVAALVEDVTLELIADGVHLHPAVLRLAVAAAGVGRIVLVSDAVAAAGTGQASFAMGGRTVQVQGRQAILEGGTLAGSLGTLQQAVQVAVFEAGLPLGQAVRMASTHPARVLGPGCRLGQLRQGWPADLVVLDERLQVAATLVGGRLVYCRPQELHRFEAAAAVCPSLGPWPPAL